MNCAALMGVADPQDLFDYAAHGSEHARRADFPARAGEARVRCGDVRASGAFFDLTDAADAGSLAYSILEGIAFSIADRLRLIAGATPGLMITLIDRCRQLHRFWGELLATVATCRWRITR